MYPVPAKYQPILVSGQCRGAEEETGHSAGHGVEGQSDRHIHRAASQADGSGQECCKLTITFRWCCHKFPVQCPGQDGIFGLNQHSHYIASKVNHNVLISDFFASAVYSLGTFL